MGELSRRAARLDRATAALEEALKTGREHLGERHPEIATAYDHSAHVYLDRGDYQEAIHWYTRALELRLALLGPRHPDVARSRAGRANAHRASGELERALADGEEALSLLEVLSPGHSDVAWAQNILGAVHAERGEYEEAFALYQRARATLEASSDPEDAARLARVYGSLGIHYDDTGDFDQALVFYQKALSLQLATLVEGHPELAGTYNNMGTAYDVKGDNERALSAYEKAVAVYLAAGKAAHPGLAYCYTNLGMVHLKKRDYEQAIAFLNKALAVFRSTVGESHPEASAPHNNLGLLYAEMGDYDRAIAHHEKALAIEIKSQGALHNTVASSYNNMGAAYAAKGDFARAIQLYEKALAVRLRALGPQHPEVASIERNLGDLYRRQRGFGRALAHHKDALAIFRSAFGPHHPQVAQSLNEIGDVYREQGRAQAAMRRYDEAIHANVPSLPPGADPASLRPGSALSDVLLVESLDRRAQVLGSLEAAVSTYETASTLIERIRRSYRAEGSRLFLAEKAALVYERALRAALRLHDGSGEPRHAEAAFRFAERGRSGVLLDALSEAVALESGGIPAELRARERALRLDLSSYEQSLEEERLRGPQADAMRIALWQDKRFGLKQAYDKLLQQLEKEYPDYYGLKYGATTTSVAELQARVLGENQALVEYFTGSDSFYVFVITKRGFVARVVEKASSFEAQVEELRRGIVEQDLPLYIAAARGLYEQLVRPVADELAGKSLVLVPDGVLSTVPFEALLAADDAAGRPSSGGYADLAYLLDAHAVAYSYSATLLSQENNAARPKPRRDYLGLAPALDADLVLSEAATQFVKQSLTGGSVLTAERLLRPLPATRKEVTGIQARLESSHGFLDRLFASRSRIRLGRDAREDELKREALADYRYLHFATHGIVNETSPRLSGLLLGKGGGSAEDGILRLGEVYDLKLGADLVVLSACETGLGRLAKGEGTIGLTRGFLYAGARDVLVSLWQVGDATTADLMLVFYDRMLRGEGKAEALREAKRELIRRNPEYAKPYYWAPFVLVGR
jgi:CHAT domain-containing protein/Flp pilus assembly protein TadD